MLSIAFLKIMIICSFVTVFSTEHIKTLDSQIVVLNQELEKLQKQLKKQNDEKEDANRRLRMTGW